MSKVKQEGPKVPLPRPQGQHRGGLAGHEPSALNVRNIMLVLLGLSVLAVVIHVGTWFLMMAFARSGERANAQTVAVAAIRELPPQPRLEYAPEVDAQQRRARQNALLHSYGPRDPRTGMRRIPIERAMELVARSGKRAGPYWQIEPVTSMVTSSSPTRGDRK